MILLRQKTHSIKAVHDYNFMQEQNKRVQEIKNGLSKTNRFLPKSTIGKLAVLGAAGVGGTVGIASEMRNKRNAETKSFGVLEDSGEIAKHNISNILSPSEWIFAPTPGMAKEKAQKLREENQ
jgi:F0F1-type ATP synthase beta subunit